jgi:hypothetical protein
VRSKILICSIHACKRGIRISLCILLDMDRRRSQLITANQFMFHLDMGLILIAEVVLSFLLRPPRISMLLPLLLLAPVFRILSFLDLLILFPTFPLFREWDDPGISNLPKTDA